ncbi:MAG: PP2C family protein-serine/threonine phosphatase, partial [Terriglobia bacterium]
FRQNELIPLTEDQTVGNLMQAESRGLPISAQMKDMLTQAVGAQPKVEVALTRCPLTSGDCLLLCCDGLYKVVADEDVKEILNLPASPEAKAEGLVARANHNGGPDNISVILAELR